MGGNTQVKIIQRQSGWLENTFTGEVITQSGLEMTVDCPHPHCNNRIAIGDLLEFGKIYEFSCPHCENKFTLVLPMYQVISGTIEGVMYGKSGDQS